MDFAPETQSTLQAGEKKLGRASDQSNQKERTAKEGDPLLLVGKRRLERPTPTSRT